MKNTIIPSYQEGLKELRSNLNQILPPKSADIFDKDAESLNASLGQVLKVKQGNQAPDFTLSNALGESVSLSHELKSNKILLVFYRGTWCPYCNLALSQYQLILNQIKATGTKLIAVSPQTPDESLSLKEKNNLQFEVLSDNGNLVARRYTTVFKNLEPTISEMKNLGVDFTSYYSDDSQEIPVPAVFIIEKNGIISYAKSEGGDFRNRTEPSQIIQKLSNNQNHEA